MTAHDRFERDLPMDLENLAAPHTPEYLTDILSRTATTSQRPAWTFPERWLPMADIASRRAFAPRLPWRTIALALIVIALIAVAAAAFVGSRQTKLPPPFGLARNGVVVDSMNGDIYATDPVTHASKAIVTGPATDVSPGVSPDGTQVVFLRKTDNALQWDLGVVGIDGTGLRIITTQPIWEEDSEDWGPDSRSIIVSKPTGTLLRLDATKAAPPTVIAEHVNTVGSNPLRPPDAAQILYSPQGITGAALWVMNLDGSGAHALIEKDAASATQFDFRNRAWSPDGKRIAFTMSPKDAPTESRIYVMDADGSHQRPLTQEPGAWFETDLAWSPDSTHIAFNRWQLDPSGGDATVHPIGIASLAGGSVLEAGPTPAPEGAAFGYTPDGTIIVSLPGKGNGLDPSAPTATPIAISTADGTFRSAAGLSLSWQRLALEP